MNERPVPPSRSGRPGRAAGGWWPPGFNGGLDWLNFFVANLQTAFGPFVSAYLTGEHWTQGQIGFALSVGTATSMASQVPAGAMVDAMRSKRLAAAVSIVAIIVSCLMLAGLPQMLPVLIAEVLHGFASCMLGPAIAAISLVAAGTAAGALGVRLGRNSRWASIGNGIAAALMAGSAYLLTTRAVFVVGSLLAIPGLYALRWIGPPARAAPSGVDPAVAERRAMPHGSVWALLRERNLIGFAVCAAFFHLANAAMLPLAASEVTRTAGADAALVIGASIVLPQLIVAVLSPTVGAFAERIGRKPVLLAGFAALPIRGLLFATTSNPLLIVAIQALDGISSAVFGVMLPLIAADVSRRTGRFNLCLGILGLGMGVGATLSTALGGRIADLSERLAFLDLAGAGAISVVLVAVLMRESKDVDAAA